VDQLRRISFQLADELQVH